MKKTILGSVMMLSGVVGFVGWCIACTNLQGGQWSGIIGDLDGLDAVVAIMFLVFTVIGFVIAVQSIKNDDK